MTDDISELYTLQILPAEIRKGSGGAAYIVVEVQAMQIDGDKGLHAFFSNMDEFMNRLGAHALLGRIFAGDKSRICSTSKAIVSVAGSDAELAFTEGELRELGLEEVDALRAA